MFAAIVISLHMSAYPKGGSGEFAYVKNVMIEDFDVIAFNEVLSFDLLVSYRISCLSAVQICLVDRCGQVSVMRSTKWRDG